MPLVRYWSSAQTIDNVPLSWTNFREADDFERVSDGRSLFRPDDLLALVELVDTLLEGSEEVVK